MDKSKISYQQSIDEIEKILNQIESEDLTIDELSDKIKKASELLKLCKTKLKQTEKDVEDIINDIEE